MKKILLAIGFFVALNTEAQVVNKFRDSSVFFKGVRFDSTLVFKGLKAGSTADTNVVVISSTGKASKISKSAFLGDLPIYSISDSNTVINYDVLNSQNTPPVSPSTGDVYLVGNSPTGAWVGHTKDIAEWNGSAWVFTDGVQGDFLYNATNALTYIFRSGNWVQTTGIPALNNGNRISSGLRIGTNNARSLTFETNNVNRGRFDSIGRFHIYNLPTSSTSDTFVTKSDLSGKLTKVGKSTFLSGVNTDTQTLSLIRDTLSISNGNSLKLPSTIFPNGGKIIEDTTYEITHSDAGYLLYFPYETTVTHSIFNPLIESDVIGVQFYEPNSTITMDALIVELYLYSQLQSGDAEKGEVAIFQAIQDGEILPLFGLKIDESDGNKMKTINRYLYDKSQNANSYSTDEKRTGGTWIDGKPIYRKVFVGNVAEDTSINISSLNIENIIKIYSDLKDLDDNYYNGYLEQSDVIVDGVDILLNIIKRGATYFFPDSELQIKNSFIKYKLSDGSVFSSGYNLLSYYNVIIEYTKTTD